MEISGKNNLTTRANNIFPLALISKNAFLIYY